MTTIKIKGMSCQHCVMAVTKALGSIEDLKDVQRGSPERRSDLYRGEARRSDSDQREDKESGV